MLAYCVTISILFATVKSAKILVVVPTPSISHQVVFRPLIQELIKGGHELVVITTDPVYRQGVSPNNLTEIDLHDLSYALKLKVLNVLAKCNESDYVKIKTLYSMLSEIFQRQLNDKSVQNLIRNKNIKFDLLIIENYVPVSFIFSKIFKAPVIAMSTLGALPGDMKMMGSETHPIIYPTHYHTKKSRVTIWERIHKLHTDVLFNNLRKTQELNDDRILLKIFGIHTPAIDELKNNIHMLFLNVHPIWIYNQAVPPNVVYTWGVHNPESLSLPKELQSYLDSSEHGVIYMSFGSNFKTSAIPLETLGIFMEVLSRLPYNILWKWDADDLPGKPENVKISKWFPQWDVLRHPNLKFFITHGGLQSTKEAIDAGVPLIGVPLFGDQDYNTEKYVHFKIGVKLDFESLTVGSFERAINSIVNNYHGFKKNIVQLRTLMNDRPQPVLEHVMWRIEYLLRHGGVQHLRSPAANMSWAEYYELEIILLILSAMIVLGAISFLAVSFCFINMLTLIKNVCRK